HVETQALERRTHILGIVQRVGKAGRVFVLGNTDHEGDPGSPGVHEPQGRCKKEGRGRYGPEHLAEAPSFMWLPGDCTLSNVRTTQLSSAGARRRAGTLEGLWLAATARPASHRLQVRVAPLVKLVVGIAHGVRLAAAEHDLEIDRPEAVVL